MAAYDKESRPNFFLLLELDPDASWDHAHFEEVLNKKRNQWNRESGGIGKAALDAKANKGYISEMRQVMQNDELRAREADVARREHASKQQATQQARRAEFDRQLEYLNTRQSIEQVTLDRFIDQFKDLFPRDYILKQIKPTVVSEKENARKDAIAPLDSSTWKEITELLEVVHKSTLYDFLECPKTTANDKLYEAAQRLYDTLVHQPKSPEIDVKLNLVSHARNIFKNSEMRARYNESLRQSEFGRLLKDLGEIIKFSPHKEVPYEPIRLFLQKAQSAGWDEGTARALLKEHAQKFNWYLQMPEPAPKVLCVKCGTLNEKKKNYCSRCGYALYINCPKCRSQIPSSEENCGNCGFPVGNRLLIENKLKECSKLLQVHNLREAKYILRYLEGTWPTENPDDKLLQHIEKCRTELQQLQQHLTQLMEQRHFYAALEFLKPEGRAISEQETKRMQTAIDEAQRELQLARTTSMSQDDKRLHCIQALQLCADFKEARDFLRTLPPEPPFNLQIQMRMGVVSLAWDASPTQQVQISYTIIRKPGSQPISVTDGEKVATTAGCIYEDTQPIVGIPVYYAVFSVCEEIASVQGALSSDPCMFVQDIIHARIRAENSRIILSWEPSPYVDTIIVVRKEQTAPTSIHDGVRLPLIERVPKQVIDSSVQNEHTYYYRIYSQFQNHMGAAVLSQGLVRSATPTTPPLPITELTIEREGALNEHRVRLSWQVPATGQVVILKARTPQRLDVGTVLAIMELHTRGEVLEDHPDTVTDVLSEPETIYYIPVILVQDMAYIGKEHSYSTRNANPPNVHRVEVNYEIKKLVFHNPELHITARRAGKLPALYLVYKAGRPPFTRDDGEILLLIEPRSIYASEKVRFPLPKRNFDADTWCKLFVASARDSKLAKIYHPEMKNLRLDT